MTMVHVTTYEGDGRMLVTYDNGESLIVRNARIFITRQGRRWVRVLSALADVEFQGVVEKVRTYSVRFVLQVVGWIERMAEAIGSFGVRFTLGWTGLQLEIVRKEV